VLRGLGRIKPNSRPPFAQFRFFELPDGAIKIGNPTKVNPGILCSAHRSHEIGEPRILCPDPQTPRGTSAHLSGGVVVTASALCAVPAPCGEALGVPPSGVGDAWWSSALAGLAVLLRLPGSAVGLAALPDHPSRRFQPPLIYIVSGYSNVVKGFFAIFYRLLKYFLAFSEREKSLYPQHVILRSSACYTVYITFRGDYRAETDIVRRK